MRSLYAHNPILPETITPKIAMYVLYTPSSEQGEDVFWIFVHNFLHAKYAFGAVFTFTIDTVIRRWAYFQKNIN